MNRVKISSAVVWISAYLAASVFCHAQQPAGTLNAKTDGTAVGDGIVDDTAAINSLMSAASAQGKDVYFPEGTYRITSQVTVLNGVGCYGDASGISLIKSASKIDFGETTYGVAVKNIEIADLFFLNTRLNLTGPYKENIQVERCVFACADGNHDDDKLVSTRGKNNLFDSCIFLVQDNTWNEKGMVSFDSKDLIVRHCIFGLDMGNLGWLDTEWSGYSNWNEPENRLEDFRAEQGLDTRLGAFRGAARFNDDNGVYFYSNILNFDPVFCGTDQSPPDNQRPDIDHVIYCTQVSDLEFISNWIRGHPQSPAGGLKHRNSYGPGVIAANLFDDTPLLTYTHDNDAVLELSNQLYYRNHFIIRTPESVFVRNGISYLTQDPAGNSESNIVIAANTYDCADGLSSISLGSGNPAQFHVYDSNQYISGTPIEIVGNNGPYSYAAGSPDSALTSPYDGYAVPMLSIPVYGDAPPIGPGPGTREFETIEDTCVKQAAPGDNFGSASVMNLRTEGTTEMNGYLKFEISDIPGPVSSAKLRLYSQHDHQLKIHEVSDLTWSETGMTWNNRPAIGTLIASVPALAGQWVELDVSDRVVSNGTFAFGLKTTNASYRNIDSREGANAPELRLTYVDTTADGDLDGDQLPNGWETAYFENATNGVAIADGDGDGFDNLAEFISGSDPTNGASYFMAGSIHDVSGFIISWAAISNREYGVWHCGALTNAFTHLASGIQFPQNSYTDTAHGAESEGFYRVDVQLAP